MPHPLDDTSNGKRSRSAERRNLAQGDPVTVIIKSTEELIGK
jgi:hypothetical protein